MDLSTSTCNNNNTPFRFKHFSVHHDKSTLKVGTDAVVLGAWTNVAESKHILDIGTGCGIIALMLLQRTQTAKVLAIDIDADSVAQAQQNAQLSPWKDRMQVQHTSLQQLTAQTTTQFDTIVSNPPFFAQSLKSPNEQLNKGKHNDNNLPFDTLINCVAQLLSPNGSFSVILPTQESHTLMQLCKTHNLYPSRTLLLQSKPTLPPYRILTQYKFGEQPLETQTCCIHTPTNDYTPEYKILTKDFYLKF